MANENEVIGDEVIKIIATKKDIWPQNVESYFITLLEEEVKKGNRQATTLTKPAWKHIKEELKKEFGKEYTMEQFKNKYNQLRQKWKDFINLVKMEIGLRYNSATGQIIATEDKWKKLCEKYKFAKNFKKKGCLHYDKLCIIFGDTTTFGANQHPSTKSPSINNDDDSEGNNDFDQEDHNYPTIMKGNVSCDTKKRKARENVHMAFTNALTIMGEIAKRNIEVLERMSTSNVVGSYSNVTGEVVGQNSVQDKDKDQLMACLEVLETLEGIDGVFFAKAVKLLKEDPLWRDVFMALSIERKKDFVLNLS